MKINLNVSKNNVHTAIFIALIFVAAGIAMVSFEELSVSATILPLNETDAVINDTAIYSNKTSSTPENSR
jgi:hypothetical protein